MEEEEKQRKVRYYFGKKTRKEKGLAGQDKRATSTLRPEKLDRTAARRNTW